MGGRRRYAQLLSRGPIATLVPFVPFYPYRHRDRAVEEVAPLLVRAAGQGRTPMSAENRHFRLLPRTRASESWSVGRGAAVSAAHQHASPTPPAPAGRRTVTTTGAMRAEAAGGAVGIVAAGGFGSGRAGGTGPQDLDRRRSRARNGVHGLSGRTGRRGRYGVGQIRANLSNVATPECECMSMYGIEGRVVPGAIAVAGYSVSSAVETSVLRADEPARGVGGLLQPTTPSVEPPVSSLNGSERTPTTTAPAPIGVLAGVVSPRTSAVGAAVGAEPAGRMSVKKAAG
jgi:hypothetical protein